MQTRVLSVIGFFIGLFVSSPSGAQTREEVLQILQSQPEERVVGAGGIVTPRSRTDLHSKVFSIEDYRRAIEAFPRFSGDAEVVGALFKWLHGIDACIEDCAKKTGRGRNTTALLSTSDSDWAPAAEVAAEKESFESQNALLRGWLREIIVPAAIQSAHMSAEQGMFLLQTALAHRANEGTELQARVAELQLKAAGITQATVSYENAHDFLLGKPLVLGEWDRRTSRRFVDYLAAQKVLELLERKPEASAADFAFLEGLASDGGRTVASAEVSAKLLAVALRRHIAGERRVRGHVVGEFSLYYRWLRPTLLIMSVVPNLAERDAVTVVDALFAEARVAPLSMNGINGFVIVLGELRSIRAARSSSAQTTLESVYEEGLEAYIRAACPNHPRAVAFYIDELERLVTIYEQTRDFVSTRYVRIISFLNDTAALPRDEVGKIRRLLARLPDVSHGGPKPQVVSELEHKVRFGLGGWLERRNWRQSCDRNLL